MRYFIKFCYDGSSFYGFQRQKDKVTVQGELEKALSIISKKKVCIKGAGRTDVGVHALGQCAHFDLQVSIPVERLKKAINRIVAPYILILECKNVGMDFHARFSVKSKKYIYKINIGSFIPFKYRYYYFYENTLNLNKLRECADLFIGKHNFHNFVSGDREHFNGSIEDIEIHVNHDEVAIVFKGRSFYRYMVRNLVGAMLDYNEGKCELFLIKKMLEEDYFNYQLRCAPARGLYLEGVYYE
ncbi:MAG: tRNA pseudouridine(38-40) synthase TruA [Bacilli bacterium]|nr:tRNA pseudouridine(38-40) synthase TruA [Bacilli bacterium]